MQFCAAHKRIQINTFAELIHFDINYKMRSVPMRLNLSSVKFLHIKGYCTSYQKLACFVLYLKIINTFLKKNTHHKLFKEFKNGIETLVGQAVFKIYRNSQNVVLINNSRTTWPTLILTLFLSSLENLL